MTSTHHSSRGASPRPIRAFTSRREFLSHSGKAVAGTVLAGAIATHSHAQENHTIKIALVGCGGRGGGAALNTLSTKGPTKLWALTDVFEDRMGACAANLSQRVAKQVDVPPGRQFGGFDGFKKAIDSLAAARPRIYRNQAQTRDNETWRYSGPTPDPYQVEHDLLFDAIRNNKPWNEADRCAQSCLAAIMGRMACESGKMISWEDALKSDVNLAPGLENLNWNSKPPVQPDASGRFRVAVPGRTTAV